MLRPLTCALTVMQFTVQLRRSVDVIRRELYSESGSGSDGIPRTVASDARRDRSARCAHSLIIHANRSWRWRVFIIRSSEALILYKCSFNCDQESPCVYYLRFPPRTELVVVNFNQAHTTSYFYVCN